MATSKRILKVYDSKGFYYEVNVQDQPAQGFSTAYYKDRIIAQCELGRITEPYNDNDRDWELYEERLSEWINEIDINLLASCKQHFDKK